MTMITHLMKKKTLSQNWMKKQKKIIEESKEQGKDIDKRDLVNILTMNLAH